MTGSNSPKAQDQLFAPGTSSRAKYAALVVGRPGGPAFRPSELARLTHLTGIIATVLAE